MYINQFRIQKKLIITSSSINLPHALLPSASQAQILAMDCLDLVDPDGINGR